MFSFTIFTYQNIETGLSALISSHQLWNVFHLGMPFQNEMIQCPVSFVPLDSFGCYAAPWNSPEVANTDLLESFNLCTYFIPIMCTIVQSYDFLLKCNGEYDFHEPVISMRWDVWKHITDMWFLIWHLWLYDWVVSFVLK